MKKLNAAMAALAATVMLTAAGAASAQSLTRAEVVAQLKAAQASGQLAALTGEDSGSAYLSRHFQASEPRAEVKAELATAEKSGHFDALYGEDSGSFFLAHGGNAVATNSAVAMATPQSAGQ